MTTDDEVRERGLRTEEVGESGDSGIIKSEDGGGRRRRRR